MTAREDELAELERASKIRLARALVRSSARDGVTESERIRAIAALPLPEDKPEDKPGRRAS